MTQHGIVVGVDGSSASSAAARWAAHAATMRNIGLTLVNAINTPSMDLIALGGPVAALPAEPSRRQQDQAQAIIDDAVAAVRESTEEGARPRIDHRVFFAGAVNALLELSQTAQLLVVGRRGQGMLRRLLLGSVSTGLIHHAHCPVAVVHQETPFAREPWALPVVLGVDGSAASERATAIAFEEASFRGVELVAVHAWSSGGVGDVDSPRWSALQTEAEEALAERLAGWRERYPDVGVRRRLVWNHPARYLLEEAESAQLVVVGSRGRGGFAGMLLGSVSTAVVQGAPVPVIVARQP